MKPGPRNLITDVAGLRVGNAEDATIKTGTTVLTADAPFVAAVDVMGGAPGTRETDLLDPDKSVEAVDALVLYSVSAFAIDTGSGVMDGLRAAGRGLQVGPVQIPLVPGAILFDMLNGGDKDWDENPYRALGRAAFEAATTEFALGSVGAGTGALTANMKGGLGSASLVLDNGVTVGALVAANPFGSVTTPGERYFWASPFEVDGEFGGLGPDPRSGLIALPVSKKIDAFNARGNTTIAIVATDAALTKAQAKRVAVMAQDGMGRAISPAHSPFDGDLVFAAATGQHPITNAGPEIMAIGHAAALCLSRAIARGIHAAKPASGDILPSWAELNQP